MQVKKASLSTLRANRQLVQADRQAAKAGQVQSNKELAQAASKIQVTKKPEIKPGHVSFQERIPTSPTHEEQAAMVFSVSYLEQQAQSAAGGESVSCYRSAGAVPIPTRRCSVIEPKPKPPKPRKLSLPESFAESALMNWSLEMAPILEAGHGKAIKIHAVTDEDGYVDCPNVHDAPVVSKAPPKKLAETATIPFWVMEEASYLEANLGEPVQAEVVTDEDGYVTRPKFQDAPTVCKAPPKKQSKNNCNTHTRCQCAIFSKQIAGLFDVGKY